MRPIVFIAALIAGVSYCFHDALALPFAADVAWKASGCALLALWAALGARSAEGWLLAAAFAVYALADALLDAAGAVIGAGAFIAAHLLMIVLYLRHRRRPLGSEDWMIAGLMLVAVPLAGFVLPERRADGAQVALYAVVLSAMATAALLSDFRRDRVLLGAMLFVASDLLIFAKLGALRDHWLPDLMIWPLYSAAQALIVTGMAGGLKGRRP